MSGDVTHFVEDAINESGYPLELHVSSVLQQKFPIWYNDYYFDYDENKPRTIDLAIAGMDLFVGGQIAAEELIQGRRSIDINMAIECKKTNSAWIFFEGDSITHSKFIGQLIDYNHIVYDQFTLENILWKYDTDLSLHYGEEGRPSNAAYSYHVVKLKKEHSNKVSSHNKSKDEIFEAVNQVVKYVSYNLNERKQRIEPRFVPSVYPVIILYYPVIVFDGHLYKGFLENGRLKVREIDHTVLSYKYRPIYSTEPKTFYIDIIKKEYLEHFVDIIIKECRLLDEYWKVHNQEFSEHAKSLHKDFVDRMISQGKLTDTI